jgi:hypothetical protein
MFVAVGFSFAEVVNLPEIGVENMVRYFKLLLENASIRT